MKLALVHDWLNQVGGAEDVLADLAALYPGAPIYTSLYAPDLMPGFYETWDIRTLWMDRLPGIHTHHQPYLPLYPLAWGGLDLSAYDVVLSNKSGFCHGLRHDAETLHVCYCLAPTRYVWQFEAYVQREGLSALQVAALRPMVALLKGWDRRAADWVDHFIAISSEVQDRVRRWYGRESTIIYPPVDTTRFTPAPATGVGDEAGDYFLIVSRHIPYKRIDLAVQACSALGLPLKVGGAGRDTERLKALAGPTVEFLGFVPDDDLPGLMAHCRAFLFPGLEDFGITPVQAMAAGRPVIAFAGGGALDTVIPGETGELFEAQTVKSLGAALRRFDPARYDVERIRAHALRFDASVFAEQITAYVERAWADFQQGKRRT
ncbi:MAG: glycosyltransferase [Anaerolineae bacterium]|nr:glycosyltransferase [Anaerolineae bacterium]